MASRANCHSPIAREHCHSQSGIASLEMMTAEIAPCAFPLCRRMYDQIVQESPTLPSGVNLATVLEGCGERDVAEVMQMIPNDQTQLSAASLAAAGMPCRVCIAHMSSCV